jgi:conjugative transposon TraJ protein
MVLPLLGRAQSGGGLAEGIHGLEGVLDDLYNSMIPQCSQLIGVGQGLAGFAALWYIAVRVWRHIANAEPVDLFPLLRPFVIGGAIVLFPSVIALMNGVLQPIVAGTAQMEGNANAAIATLLQEKEAALKQTIQYQMYVGDNGKGNEDLWEAYTRNTASITNPTGYLTNGFQFAMAKAFYNFKNSIKAFMSEVLQVLYEAAALCINTLRTFQLIVLAILGPLVLGLSVFDGFQHTLRVWLSRYINVFLWLPVASIFGAIIANIQANMVKLDIQQIQATGGTYFSSTDIAYLIFLIIGIIGYFTVPSVAGFIVNVGGSGALASKATGMAGAAAARMGRGAGNIAGAAGQVAGGYNAPAGEKNKNSAASKAGAVYGRWKHQQDRIGGSS